MKKRPARNSTYFSKSALSIRIFVFLIILILPGWQVFAQNGFSSLSVNSGKTDSLYDEMIFSVEVANCITASVRQTIRLFGQEYHAYGTYNELKPTELRGHVATRFRLDIKVQTSNDNGDTKSQNSLTVVCDNTYNYIYRFLSIEGETRLERIEIKRVVEAIEKLGCNDMPTEVGSLYAMGGLAGMLREMRNRYDFNTAPIMTNIPEKNSTVGAWKIRGRLKPEIVATLTGEGSGKKQTIPIHTPTTIDISIGVDDRFPYRIDYFWTPDGAESTDEPFAYLVFYNLILHTRSISDSIFDYRPPENILEVDVTEQVIYQMMATANATK